MKPALTLAIETSTRVGSVALLHGADRVEETLLDAGAVQGRELAPAVSALLEGQGVEPRGLDLIAVGLGPGSYTGLRVGIALAKTLAFAASCDLVGVSSFAALAQAQGAEGETLLTLCKAGQADFYHALFRIERGRALAVREHAITEQAKVTANIPEDARILGEGADKISEMGQAHLVPTAQGVAQLGYMLYQEEGPTPEDRLLPLYLRKSSAELNWERNRARKKQGNKGKTK